MAVTRRQTRKPAQRTTRRITQLPRKLAAGAPVEVILAAPTNLQVEIIDPE